MKLPRRIIPKRMTFLTMSDNQKFIPLSLSKTLTSPSPFIPLSVTYPETKFEPLTKENWEEMKKKNSKKSVDSFKPIW